MKLVILIVCLCCATAQKAAGQYVVNYRGLPTWDMATRFDYTARPGFHIAQFFLRSIAFNKFKYLQKGIGIP